MSSINGSSSPQTFDSGAVGRTLKYAVGGAVTGAVAGGVGGTVVPVLGNGVGLVGGALVGGVAGLAAGLKSKDTDKLQNRPITIHDPLFDENKTVYISPEQFRGIKDALAKGVSFDNLPGDLAQQFQGDVPAPAGK